MCIPEKRKPVAVEATGFQNLEVLGGNFDDFLIAENLAARQAEQLRRRFRLSWPLALVAAELAFGRAAQ